MSLDALPYEQTDWNKEVRDNDQNSSDDTRLTTLENKAIFNQVNVKDYGAVGDGVTDDTVPFMNAWNDAVQNKMRLCIDGNYLITENLVVEDQTIPEIYGIKGYSSNLQFNITSGYGLEIKTFHTRPFVIKDLKITNKYSANTASGIKIDRGAGSWGAGLLCKNVHITNFTGIAVELVNAHKCKFDSCSIIGGTPGSVKVATLLKIATPNTFSNVNIFDAVTFQYGKIGIQNLGGIVIDFNRCIFEDLNLFMHTPALSGLSLRNNFKACWFEDITKGILNADIDESTLEPDSPISNKSDLKFIVFENNYSGQNTPSPVLNSTLEPNYYNFFTLSDGIITRESDGSPSGVLTPYKLGEEVLDTTNNKWYKSIGLSITDWVALN